MMKVEIEGFGRFKPTDSRARDVNDEIVELSEGDTIVADGPIAVSIVEE